MRHTEGDVCHTCRNRRSVARLSIGISKSIAVDESAIKLPLFSSVVDSLLNIKHRSNSTSKYQRFERNNETNLRFNR